MAEFQYDNGLSKLMLRPFLSSARLNTENYFGKRLRAIESSMPLRKLIDSGAE